MNRILFESNEISDGIATFGGARADHIISVLHGEVGQVIKTGEINGLVGTSEILAIDPRDSATRDNTTRDNTTRDKETRDKNDSADSTRDKGNFTIRVRVNHTLPSIQPWVDLILAPPRPRVLKRLLPQLATMGVGRIILVGAKKVEKDFWGATLLKEENYRDLFIDGLMQAGTSVMPTLESRRNFREFLNRELDEIFPTGERLVAHPSSREQSNLAIRDNASTRDSRLLLAIGPEGGWTDDEVSRLEEKGFSRYSLGGRILRTDTATLALLARLGETRDVANRE